MNSTVTNQWYRCACGDEHSLPLCPNAVRLAWEQAAQFAQDEAVRLGYKYGIRNTLEGFARALRDRASEQQPRNWLPVTDAELDAHEASKAGAWDQQASPPQSVEEQRDQLLQMVATIGRERDALSAQLATLKEAACPNCGHTAKWDLRVKE